MGVNVMKSQLNIENNQGFTLIEIIASIAILGLIIAVLLPIFPQIMGWTNQSSETLVASQLLDQVAHDIRTNEDINLSNIESLSLEYEVDEMVYTPKITLSQTNEERELGLYRTHIEIYKLNEGKQLTDTYIYIMGEGN